ncbi:MULTISPECIES: glycoside hydrolase family 3 N-terminal domain-containing protein [unclassified Streptomyces]|uniref:glycoside hydrolase family 3 protein n=1 Tax=unclassified Streptomyces TaxID=2593676 RepID=UPI002ED54D6D|nr:glycoside hydrolase family 3 C-terminal domain-containing protein [Streptomyces sp. NBC_00891]WSY07972.1 glycoside hydrolase family 3 C-terminal domain-containing protein [Streptomyces sp. NBC_00890]WSZ09597.1 glycoside hydrolase family 3 C-terminal domain-containing protein [Streptomyces sp. NBC_00869]WSZ22903.1 glycoside hydrolase family 3 C-terminal domain-containing protein [Streptomyces sp. NBC_00870]
MPPRTRRRARPATAVLAAATVVAGLLAGAVPSTAAPAADEPAPVAVDRFEGEVPFANQPAEGIFTWGGDADDPPTLALKDRADAPEGAKVLEGTYDISGYGGFSHDYAADQPAHDWSAHKGIRFWWYGQNTAPLPPGSGKRIAFEIKDGGANGEASELWTTSFTDDWEGWHLVEIPFADFAYRGDYQPVGGIDQVLGLNEMWGYALTLPPGAPGTFAMDGVELYGKADAALKASVVTDAAVVPVEQGASAALGLTVTTTGSVPLDEPVTVAYETKGGTAKAGTDFTPVSGTYTFPAGTASGTTHKVTVATKKVSGAASAKTIPLDVTVTGARPPKENPQAVIDAHGLPYQNAKLPVKQRVADLLSRMSPAEKAGQMTQAERNALSSQGDIAAYDLGSLLSGGGSVPSPNTPEAWAKMIDGYQLRAQATRFQIPLIYGVDAVHGHNNLVGSTIMPHNVGLGATRDPKLAEKTGAVTASEVRATGVPWDFAPCLCVSRDERWGRSYESYGEDPALVQSLETVIQGMQGAASGKDLDRNDKVLATAKHYVGDGGTEYGSSTTGSYTTDQGVTKVTRQELEAVHLAPFSDAVKRGVGTVMPSYSSLDIIGDDKGPVKMHADAEMINGVLKDRMGFKGFVISDYKAIDQIPGDYASDVRTSINAGLDMIMVPTEYKDFTRTLQDEVAAGRIPQSRIDDAVSRILTQKFELGLFEKPYADTSNLKKIGSAEHRAVAREAAAKSQVLLKNDGGVLPLKSSQKVYVAGSNADDIGNQAGGWTVSWQGSSGPITPGTTILSAMKKDAASVTYSKDASADTAGYDVGVVVVGETPYAEGIGDVGNGHDLELSDADKAAVDKVCAAMKCAVLIVSGRPQLIGDRLDGIDALVASWLPGTEGDGVADVLFGKRAFTGQLPVTWPKSEAQLPINVGDKAYDPQFPYGWGLTTLKKPPAGGELTLTALALAAQVAERTGLGRTEVGREIVGQARLLVQQKTGGKLTEKVSKPFADADHLLLTGDLTGAVAKLRTAYRAA